MQVQNHKIFKITAVEFLFTENAMVIIEITIPNLVCIYLHFKNFDGMTHV